MKVVKILISIILILVVAAFIAVKIFSEKKPEGISGPDADILANKVLVALNKPAFDSIPYLQFDFFGGKNKYFWDKQNEEVIIAWGGNKVIMDLKTLDALCFEDGKKVEGKKADKMKSSAWSKWCNDSFWMIAPFKLFDPGTTRKLVDIEAQGHKGLLIEYASGGVTPGDGYLWILDKNNQPTGWKMWTKILPVKGLYTSWDGWQDVGGAKLSTRHKFPFIEAKMENVKAGHHFSEFGYTSDPFKK